MRIVQNTLFLIILGISLINNALSYEHIIGFTGDIAYATHENKVDKLNHSRYYFRGDWDIQLLENLIGGGFFETFILSRSLDSQGKKGGMRFSIGGDVAYQKADWFVKLLFGYATGELGIGMTAQIEVSYLFRFTNELFIGPKWSLRSYILGSNYETFFEPQIHAVYWFGAKTPNGS